MKRILIGMTLKDYHHALLQEKGVDYQEVKLHAFTYDYDPGQVRDAISGATGLVVTSGRALQALTAVAAHIVDTPVYAVGQRTASRLAELGCKYVTAADSCEGLVAINPWDSTHELLYLCGNLRRDILPDFWQREHIRYTETEVYQTHLLEPVVRPADFDIVLISSPSGVRSLIAKNSFPRTTVFASIGPVTSEELRKNGFTNIIEPARPSFELLMDEIAKMI